MKYTIDVTAEDIKNGIRGKPSSCPVALSMQRSNLRAAANYGNGTCWLYINRSIYILGDSKLYSFMSDFDIGRPVSPFSFEFDDRRSVAPMQFVLETGTDLNQV